MKNEKRSSIHLSIILLQLFFLCSSGPLWAQTEQSRSMDIVGPEIKHRVSFQSKTGPVVLSFEALVSDDRSVTDVILHYRSVGATDYTQVKMQSVGSGNYSISISGKEVVGLKVEYYIHAFDEEGNSSVEGEPDVPLSVTLEPKVILPPKPWYKKFGDWAWRRGSKKVDDTLTTIEDIFE